MLLLTGDTNRKVYKSESIENNMTKPKFNIEKVQGILSQIKDPVERKYLLDQLMLDGLTGLYSRKVFDSMIETKVAESIRYGKDLGLVLFDIDHFKKINDSEGHQAGDYVLEHMGELCRNASRRSDTPAIKKVYSRYGGEEFSFVLPETNLKNTAKFAERFREQVFNEKFKYEGKIIPVTISLGVSSFSPLVYDHQKHAKDGVADQVKKLIKGADDALYVAKGKGRNRVELYGRG